MFPRYIVQIVMLQVNPFDYGPQHNAPGPVQAAFHQHQAEAEMLESLRQLGIRYLHHPGTQVGTVSTGAGTPGGFSVVIILQSPVLF